MTFPEIMFPRCIGHQGQLPQRIVQTTRDDCTPDDDPDLPDLHYDSIGRNCPHLQLESTPVTISYPKISETDTPVDGGSGGDLPPCFISRGERTSIMKC